MSLRNRIGTFFLLGAAISLFIFAASVFSPTGEYEVMALAAGAVLLFVGWRWRMAKGGRPPPRAAMPAATAPPPPAAPKKQGRLGTLFKGPAKKAAGGGALGGGGGKPAGGKPGGGGAPGGGPPSGGKKRK